MRALLLALMPGAALAQCDPAPPPVVTLAFDSRYEAGDATRSEIVEAAEAAAEAALEPVDDFIRALATDANRALQDLAEDKPERARERAACVAAQAAEWARAGALGDLASPTARLTVGARLAGLALVLLQAEAAGAAGEDMDEAAAWLRGLQRDQAAFWESEAPEGARRGNLRAWAGLAGVAVGRLAGDGALRDAGARDLAFVACTAAPDGSLPREMERGRLALGYQLHALSALVPGALLLQGDGVRLLDACDGALDRAVAFAAADIAAEGTLSAALAGAPSSLFDGGDALRGFDLAWAEAYGRLEGARHRAVIEALAAPFRPLASSKLGGDQGRVWDALGR